jgi:capsule polysaccharide export protein KpsC/LpsZ
LSLQSLCFQFFFCFLHTFIFGWRKSKEFRKIKHTKNLMRRTAERNVIKLFFSVYIMYVHTRFHVYI